MKFFSDKKLSYKQLVKACQGEIASLSSDAAEEESFGCFSFARKNKQNVDGDRYKEIASRSKEKVQEKLENIIEYINQKYSNSLNSHIDFENVRLRSLLLQLVVCVDSEKMEDMTYLIERDYDSLPRPNYLSFKRVLDGSPCVFNSPILNQIKHYGVKYVDKIYCENGPSYKQVYSQVVKGRSVAKVAICPERDPDVSNVNVAFK